MGNNKFTVLSLVMTIVLMIVGVILFLGFFEIISLQKTVIQYLTFGFVGIAIVFTGVSLFFIIELSKQKSRPEIIRKQTEKLANEDDSKTESMMKESLKLVKMTESIIKNISEAPDLNKLADSVLINISKVMSIVQGVFFIRDKDDDKFKTFGTFAFYNEDVYREFDEGEGITGQVAKNRKFLYINNVPTGYITILSGLGQSSPKHLVILPIIYKDLTIGIVELASFEPFEKYTERILTHAAEELSKELVKRMGLL